MSRSKMIEAIHLMTKNLKIKTLCSEQKDNLVKVFEGDKWIYKNKNETILFS